VQATDLSVAELLAAYRGRSLSPVEAAQAYLDRIERLNPHLHAYFEVYAEASLERARASEARWRAGLPASLLEGVPLALKDLVHIAGRRTWAGSAAYADERPRAETATLVTRLLDAGAVVLGKTHLVELAYGGWGTNQGLGTPRNPWDPRVHRAPGGSSSGSGVAVAGGLAAAAIGTDTGGSVRIPAAFCGLTGLRPSLGRISHHGMELVSPTLDTAGPMCWSAHDAALLFQAMHGPDPRDAATLSLPPVDVLSRLHESVAGVRISQAGRPSLGAVEDAVWRGLLEAGQVLQGLGCVRRDEAFAGVDFAADQEETGLIISCEVYGRHGAALERCRQPGDPAARERVMRGAGIAAHRYAAALVRRQQRMRDFAAVFESTDVLLLPTLPVTAKPVHALDEADLSPSRLTRFVGYYGLCALALPCGVDEQGLPVSVQLVANAGREALLLRLGAAFQAATTHHRRRPPPFTPPPPSTAP
jgi:aspartyl-tRNA(Asn)/glutamyl-tRNA(Gln) amidotransferase subunit A